MKKFEGLLKAHKASDEQLAFRKKQFEHFCRPVNTLLDELIDVLCRLFQAEFPVPQPKICKKMSDSHDLEPYWAISVDNHIFIKVSVIGSGNWACVRLLETSGRLHSYCVSKQLSPGEIIVKLDSKEITTALNKLLTPKQPNTQ